MLENQPKPHTPPKTLPPTLQAVQPASKPTAPPADRHKPGSRRPVLPPKPPILRFSPTAWAKLLFFRDRQETEVGGFAITAPGDPLKVEEFATVQQEVTLASVSFDDQAVADFFDAQVDAGRRPDQFARIWLHTHPADSPQPSTTDEETFCRVFGRCDWAVMFVLARNGNTHARLRFNVGPGGEVTIPAQVDYAGPFGAADHQAWEAEYKANVKVDALAWRRGDYRDSLAQADLAPCSVPDDWLEGLEAMEPAERQLVLDELASRTDLWDQDAEGYHG